MFFYLLKYNWSISDSYPFIKKIVALEETIVNRWCKWRAYLPITKEINRESTPPIHMFFCTLSVVVIFTRRYKLKTDCFEIKKLSD